MRNVEDRSGIAVQCLLQDLDVYKRQEVAVKLIDYYYKKYEGTPVDAINHSMVRIRGSYAMADVYKRQVGNDTKWKMGSSS